MEWISRIKNWLETNRDVVVPKGAFLMGVIMMVVAFFYAVRIVVKLGNF